MSRIFVTVKLGELPVGFAHPRYVIGDFFAHLYLTFIEAPMLHWPDTMFTHLSGDNVLFSNDGFGQHFASESLFDDQKCGLFVSDQVCVIT